MNLQVFRFGRSLARLLRLEIAQGWPCGVSRFTRISVGGREVKDKEHSSWKIVWFCTVIVSVVALCISILFLSVTVAFAVSRSMNGASPAPAQNAPAVQNVSQNTPNTEDLKTLSGMVTDSYCGARHLRNSNRTSTECARICVHRGAGYILVNTDGSYLLRGNKSMINTFAGQRVKVLGTLDGHEIGVRSMTVSD